MKNYIKKILKEITLSKKDFSKRKVLMICIFTIIFFIGSIFYKGLIYENVGHEGEEIRSIVTSEEINQPVVVKYDKVKEICLKIGGNISKKEQKFVINVINNNQIISTVTIDAATVEEEQLISLMLPSELINKEDDLRIQILGTSKYKDDGLV
ncbi:MAG: hypothetical protein ACRC2K_09575, partial [Clostridium sp.]